MYKKVDNSPGFVKDMKTGVILNTNQSDIKRKKELLAKAKQDKLELEKLKSDDVSRNVSIPGNKTKTATVTQEPVKEDVKKPKLVVEEDDDELPF